MLWLWNLAVVQFLMMMMNCFCGMVDWRKAFSLIFSRDHCQRSSPSRISDTPRAGFEPAQNLSSGLVEWSCVAVITTTPRRHDHHSASSLYNNVCWYSPGASRKCPIHFIWSMLIAITLFWHWLSSSVNFKAPVS